ncbi:MAG: hypothetical protein N3A63_04265 [Bacteroidetes bacterium]|nr:hypothetical protein [Bacteroidota bacterium]
MDKVTKNNNNSHRVPEEFRELLKFTGAGYGVGLLLGLVLDSLQQHTSALGHWLVRTFAGEGESVFEGIYALRQRLLHASRSLAEAYGWGKLLGMTVPWIIDALSHLFGVDVYGIEGFYIPYFYALSDQIGANVTGFVFLKKREGTFKRTLIEYFHNPVMLSSLAIIILVPFGLFVGRAVGFSPATQLLTAIETIVANVCWLPPLIGMLHERLENSKQSANESN